MNNEDEVLESTLTLNRLLAWCAVGVMMWAALIHGAIKIWEIL